MAHRRVIALLAGALMSGWVPALAASFTYTSLDAPGQVTTSVHGFNDHDVVVGFVQDASHAEQGFYWSGGMFTLVPSVVSLNGINVHGLAVGQPVGDNGSMYLTYDVGTGVVQNYTTRMITGGIYPQEINSGAKVAAFGTNNFKVFHGFLLEGNVTKTVQPAGSKNTYPWGIDNAGAVVGQFTDAAHHTHGFSYKSGAYTQYDVPGAPNTFALAIANDGTMIGGESGSSRGGFVGFVESGGVYTAISPPSAGYSSVHGIGPGGEAVGAWIDSGNVEHGFIYRAGAYYQIDFPGASTTYISGVNSLGSLLGSYTLGGVTHYFIAQCAAGQTCTQ